MLRKNVKLLLEQLQVCIFAEIVFGVRCTLKLNASQDGIQNIPSFIQLATHNSHLFQGKTLQQTVFHVLLLLIFS